MIHRPVLTKEVLEYLHPASNENFIDGTLGQAGHAIEILKQNGPEGKVLGIDLDARQIENSTSLTADVKERMVLVNDSYANIQEIAKKENFKPVNGILLDLGYSSWHLENSNRGFSFNKNEALDMRYDLHNTLTAEKIVNEYREDELVKILQDFGEEKFARHIAREIIRQRKLKKISSTFELIDIIASAIPAFARKSKGLSTWERAQVGAKSFQALRVAVNGELENLERFLPQAMNVLNQGGRLVILSFHSLEDRIVKNFFKQQEKESVVKILTKKPVVAGAPEVMENPRARSAKLRAIVKN